MSNIVLSHRDTLSSGKRGYLARKKEGKQKSLSIDRKNIPDTSSIRNKHERLLEL